MFIMSLVNTANSVNTMQMLMDTVERKAGVEGKHFIYKILESEKRAQEKETSRKENAGNEG